MDNRTLLIIKPDAHLRGLEKPIVERILSTGLKVVYSERRRLNSAEVEELYREHRGKPFFKVNTDSILSGPVSLLIITDDGNVVKRVRELVGSKYPSLAEKGTIRGDFGIDRVNIEKNLVHTSSSHEEAEREIALLIEAKRQGA